MELLKHIYLIDNREETALFNIIIQELQVPVKLHSFHKFSGAEEYLYLNTHKPDILIIGSAIIRLEGEQKLRELRLNHRALKNKPFIILSQSQLCKELLLTNNLENTQFIIRPLGLEDYKNTIAKLFSCLPLT